jgi:hypothetical protein
MLMLMLMAEMIMMLETAAMMERKLRMMRQHLTSTAAP